MPFILLPVASFLLTSFGDERSKTCGSSPQNQRTSFSARPFRAAVDSSVT